MIDSHGNHNFEKGRRVVLNETVRPHFCEAYNNMALLRSPTFATTRSPYQATVAVTETEMSKTRSPLHLHYTVRHMINISSSHETQNAWSYPPKLRQMVRGSRLPAVQVPHDLTKVPYL
jgi:hypothetical protein